LEAHSVDRKLAAIFAADVEGYTARARDRADGAFPLNEGGKPLKSTEPALSLS